MFFSLLNPIVWLNRWLFCYYVFLVKATDRKIIIMKSVKKETHLYDGFYVKLMGSTHICSWQNWEIPYDLISTKLGQESFQIQWQSSPETVGLTEKHGLWQVEFLTHWSKGYWLKTWWKDTLRERALSFLNPLSFVMLFEILRVGECTMLKTLFSYSKDSHNSSLNVVVFESRCYF